MPFAKPLRRVWMVVNPGSGSTDAAVIDGLAALLVERGMTVAGSTNFPDDPLPDAIGLDAARADTLLICGGDGTINAAVTAAADWDGQCLVLPGGTMNGLAKALHGDAGRDAILDAADRGELVQPPLVRCTDHSALVGVILGPAAAWVHAREGVRKGRMRRAWRAARLAWSRSFGRSIAVEGMPGRHRAVIVAPGDAGFEVATISVDGIADVMRLGWGWLAGDWRAAAGVSVTRRREITVTGRRLVKALFDGEPQQLPERVTLTSGHTTLRFVSTAAAQRVAVA